ncbi:hypothetical protein [Zobellia barbeyronii]|uniref:Uncharacterized protein n=1 Tax=Zobellia barbeyronii TaxID=2748009 RepID=A0ABS5W9C8_9FLAO|nr:hypothetical protein [Zobellia barbeyronii]MBT2160029.1 hypothetical protein [Zobellia barbeyronii]
MILSKEKYYQRRWFLAILFLLSGIWLIYMAYGMFGYHRDKEELSKGNTVPLKFLIEKSESTKNRFVVLFIENKKIGSVIEESEIDKMIGLTGKKNFAIIDSPVLRNELSEISFEYLYWNDKLYELKVNGNTVIEYKKESKFLAYLFLTIGIFWTSFQIWVIVTLATKGVSVYDKSFKK